MESSVHQHSIHATTQTKDQVQSRLLLDVVVAQGTTIFQLFTSKDQTLLVWWNAFLVLFSMWKQVLFLAHKQQHMNSSYIIQIKQGS